MKQEKAALKAFIQATGPQHPIENVEPKDEPMISGIPSNKSALEVDQVSLASAKDGTESSLNTARHMEEHEAQLQKYEADIRNHISIEQQLQLYIDSLK